MDLPAPTATLPDGSPAYRAPEAARLLGVGENTVRRWVEAGRIRGAVVPRSDLRRDFLVDAAEIARRLRRPAAPAPVEGTAEAVRPASDMQLLELAATRSELAELRGRVLTLTDRLLGAEAEIMRLRERAERAERTVVEQARAHSQVLAALLEAGPGE